MIRITLLKVSRTASLAVFCLLVAPVGAFAQQSASPVTGATGATPSATAPGPVVPPDALRLLARPDVQTELKLSKEEKLVAERLLRDQAALSQSVPVKAGVKPAPTPSVLSGVAELLTPEQMKRLRELSARHHGIRKVLSDSAVATSLNLSPASREAIRKWQVEQVAADKTGSGRTAAPLDANAEQKVVPLLTPEERVRWQIVFGEPFNFVDTPAIP